MTTRVLLLLLICMLIAFYLQLDWLIMLIAGVMVLMAIANMPVKKKQAVPTGKKEKDIIYPVIYEDVGEPPYLYPEKFDVKIYPGEESGAWTMWQNALKAIGNIFKIGIWMTKPKKKK